MTEFIDLFLRAETEAALIAALPFARGPDEDGQPIWLGSGDGYALDLIGPMVTTEGTYDGDGAELTPPVIDQRFHANLRCSAEVAALVPIGLSVEPDSPRRVWL